MFQVLDTVKDVRNFLRRLRGLEGCWMRKKTRVPRLKRQESFSPKRVPFTSVYDKGDGGISKSRAKFTVKEET